MSSLNEEIKYSYANCGNVVPEEVEEENIEDEDGEGEGEDEAADEEEADDAADDEEADNADDVEEADAADEEEEEQAEDEEDEEPEAAIGDETGLCECVDYNGQSVYFSNDNMPYIVATIDGESLQYPAMYGAGKCSAWDMDLEPSCAMNEEDYCEKEWCYVAEDCMASDLTDSSIFEGLQFSYRTCGSVAIEQTVEDFIPTLFD